jgi:hypothetical protein
MDITKKESTVYALNEKLTMKKTHACGGNEWIVSRVGAEIKLQCVRCKKFIFLTREELRRRAKPTKKALVGERK